MTLTLNFFLANLIDGIATGCIYGLFGLSLVVIYRTSHIFNFSQTQIVSVVMLLATFLLAKTQSISVVIATVLAGSFLFGLLLHLVVMRAITEKKSFQRSNEALITLGLYAIFENISAFLFSDEPQGFPATFGDRVFQFREIAISAQSLGILAITVVIAIGVYVFFKFTRIGLMMECIAENLVVAKLRGIRASNILALAWGLTTALSVLGGILIAPKVFVYPQMLISVFSYSMIAVVIGGLESPFGALVGGIAVGVVENISSMVPFMGTQLKMVGVFGLLVIVLIVKPTGIWGKPDVRRA